MIREVLDELNDVQKEQKTEQPKTPAANATRKPLTGSTSASVSSSFGNSHLIASCLMLLSQFQQQTGLVENMNSQLFIEYMDNINKALRHSNPQVRKQAEGLFKILYASFGE